VAGVLTEAGGRRFEVQYAGDCALMQSNPTPWSKRPEADRKAEEEAKRQICSDGRTHNFMQSNGGNSIFCSKCGQIRNL